MKVLAFGEIVWDIIDGTPHLGGAPLNFAAHIVKAGGESSIISQVGDDSLGKKALEEVELQGVGKEYIGVDPINPTGTVDVFLVNGQPDYEIKTEVAYDFISNTLLPSTPFDVLYYGSLAQRAQLSRDTLLQLIDSNQFMHIFYDVNLRKNGYSPATVKSSIKHATIVKLNDEEVSEVSSILFGERMEIPAFVEACDSKYHPEVILVTAGENGSYVFHNHKLIHVPGEKVQVQDAIGAGDAFSAAFMCTYFKGKDAILAAQIANKVGGFVASQKGAIPDYPSEIQKILGIK